LRRSRIVQYGEREVVERLIDTRVILNKVGHSFFRSISASRILSRCENEEHISESKKGEGRVRGTNSPTVFLLWDSGILSAINGTGAAIGPLIGGLFASTGTEGWRMAFYFQIPIIVVAAIATCIFLPTIGHSDVRLLKTKIKTIDYLGSILFVGGCTLLLLSLLFIKPPSVPFVSPSVLSCLFIGVAVLVAFFVWEGKGASHPIVPLSIFRNTSVDLIFFLNFSFGYIL
jgi:hypothetical protein